MTELNQLSGESLDITQQNINKLKELFPEILTENQIDFEKLRLILGDEINDKLEKYSFNWNGKREAIKLAQQTSTGTLRPGKNKSKNWDTTENIYIEGDNLEVLKLLQKSYAGKIKVIYIDPPYNTGNDFVYKDNYKNSIENYFKQTGQADNTGSLLSTNSETTGRFHTDWLNMMYPRLILARNLMSEDGIIFISIDDNEKDNLKKICDEIFGESNLAAVFPWQSRSSVQNDTDLSINHEYILAYAKHRKKDNRRLKESNSEQWFNSNTFAFKPMELDKTKYSNPDNDPRGPWKADPFDAPNIRPNLTYEIINPNTGEKYLPPNGRHWRTEESKYYEYLKDNRIVFGKSGVSRPQLKVFYEEKKIYGSVQTNWFSAERAGTTSAASKYLINLFDGIKNFDNPKPLKLLNCLFELVPDFDKDAIILDFFSGSATTAEAVFNWNLSDSGNRRFIMVQLPEIFNEDSSAYLEGYSNICELGIERIRRSGEKLELENKNSKLNLDVGFKVFHLDKSNIKKWDFNTDELESTLINMDNNYVEERTSEDILYEILLKLGLDLNTSYEDNIVEESQIYDVAHGNVYIVLGENITKDVATFISTKQKEYQNENPSVVFSDNGFSNDNEKLNTIEILKNNGFNEEQLMSI